MKKTHNFFFLRDRTFSEKLPKILLFGPSLIHQLQLLGSQQHHFQRGEHKIVWRR